MVAKLRKLMHDGEGLTVEFQRCENELPNSVYETVAAFSNRYGGHMLLGVDDNGTVRGVNPGAVAKIKKDFVNLLNNPQRFAPTLFFALEEAQIDGKTVLWCFVPPSSQIVMFGGRIYDRAEDGDIFKTIMPIDLSLIEMSDNVCDNGEMCDKTGDNVCDNEEMCDKTSDKLHKELLIEYLETHGEINSHTAAQILGRVPETARRILVEMASEGIIVAEGANRNRKYRLS